ncbi:MAG: Flp pilus assembly protein TadD [Sphingobacteriales bacterium]|jgi:Flp pilus assembly protein TadD
MYNREAKFAIILALVAWAVYQFTVGSIGNGIFFIFLSGLVVLTVFKNENLLWALFQLRKGDTEKALKSVDRVKAPQKLLKSQEAYYYYLRGLLESQTKSLGKAEKHFIKALKTGLRLKEDQAVAKLNLAGIAMSKRKKREAQMLLTQAKKLDKRGLLNEQVKLLQNQLRRI